MRPFSKVVDSALVTALSGALLYFAGLVYYNYFYICLGLPLTEFLPAVPLVVAKGFELLVELLTEAYWYILVTVLAVMVFRVCRATSLPVKKYSTTVAGFLRPFSGWPVLVVIILLYMRFIAHCSSRGDKIAQRFASGVEAHGSVVNVYPKPDANGEQTKVAGRVLAESTTSYAVSDEVRRGLVVIMRKESINQMESPMTQSEVASILTKYALEKKSWFPNQCRVVYEGWRDGLLVFTIVHLDEGESFQVYYDPVKKIVTSGNGVQ